MKKLLTLLMALALAIVFTACQAAAYYALWGMWRCLSWGRPSLGRERYHHRGSSGIKGGIRYEDCCAARKPQ